MNRKKLRQNYDVIDYEADGKVKSRVVYRGADYRFNEDGKRKTFFVNFSLLTFIAAIAFVLPLCFNIEIMRAIYVTMPQVFQGFSVLFLALSAYKTVTAKYPYREEAYSQIFKRPVVFSVVGAILAFLAIVGEIIYFANFSGSALDFSALVCSAVGFVTYCILFITVRGYRRKIIKTDPAPESAESTDNTENTENSEIPK